MMEKLSSHSFVKTISAGKLHRKGIRGFKLQMGTRRGQNIKNNKYIYMNLFAVQLEHMFKTVTQVVSPDVRHSMLLT